MSNFKADIISALEFNQETTEQIEAVVILSCKIAEFFQYSDHKAIPIELGNKPLTWKEVEKYFDYEYEAGFGTADCHEIRIYTSANIYYVHEYAGSTHIHSIPRNPS